MARPYGLPPVAVLARTDETIPRLPLLLNVGMNWDSVDHLTSAERRRACTAWNDLVKPWEVYLNSSREKGRQTECYCDEVQVDPRSCHPST